jgi:hypothetical protein
MVMALHHLRSLPLLQPMLLPVPLLTPMQSMVATRTISLCGMPHLLNNSSKEGRRPHLDPRLSRVCLDVALVAETSSIDACLLA